MSPRDPNLPDFANPPVVEVVLSVQFEPLPAFRAVHLGLIWREFRDRYPLTEEQPPLPPVFETFATPGQPPISLQFQVLDAPPLPRLWLLDEKRNRLVQVQQDRFIHNWRKTGEGGAYPRYERIRQTFVEELDRFCSFLRREGLGDVRPNQCEVTYLNHLEPGECWQRPGQLDRAVTVWAASGGEGILPEPEDARFAIRYLLPDDDGTPVGRLHAELHPARRAADARTILVLNLTARGRPLGEGLDGALRFMDRGREWIVRAFTSLTTECQHRVWGKRNARSRRPTGEL